mmetsp:Transcript_93059/g.267737  ORF Transcript_93059/g.267737 Transcript_93059/m.267737 type:complete len:202 (+) Transcript_93059:277-882(+)
MAENDRHAGGHSQHTGVRVDEKRRAGPQAVAPQRGDVGAPFGGACDDVGRECVDVRLDLWQVRARVEVRRLGVRQPRPAPMDLEARLLDDLALQGVQLTAKARANDHDTLRGPAQLLALVASHGRRRLVHLPEMCLEVTILEAFFAARHLNERGPYEVEGLLVVQSAARPAGQHEVGHLWVPLHRFDQLQLRHRAVPVGVD